MEQQRTQQTAFRLRPELLAKAKLKAKEKGMSLNGYVEKLMEDDLVSAGDKYEEVRRRLKGTYKPDVPRTFSIPLMDKAPEFTQEELDADPRLEYLVNKYLR